MGCLRKEHFSLKHQTLISKVHLIQQPQVVASTTALACVALLSRQVWKAQGCQTRAWPVCVACCWLAQACACTCRARDPTQKGDSRRHGDRFCIKMNTTHAMSIIDAASTRESV